MSSGESDKEAQYRLLETAQAEKNYGHSIELLEEILSIEPDAIEATIMQTHLRALTGEISLSAYREIVVAVMDRLQEESIPSFSAGKKILRAVQYSYSDPGRIQAIQAFLQNIRVTIQNSAENASEWLVLQAHAQLALEDYGGFVATLEQLSSTQGAPKPLRTLQRISEKLESPHFPDFNAPKVFGIGLSRTGTSSLNKALKVLGYDAVHWLNPHTQTVLTEEDYLLFDGFTDIPVSYQFEKLHDTFPNSKFIYTSRARESWISSVSSHYRNARGINSPAELSLPDTAQRFNGNAEAAEFNLYTQHGTWEAAFDHFQERVNRFFSDKHDGQFLELNITAGDGWEKLCSFLGKDIPGKSFPNVNKRAGGSG